MPDPPRVFPLADPDASVEVGLQLWTGLHGFVSLRMVMPELGHDMQWPSDEAFLCALVRAQLGP